MTYPIQTSMTEVSEDTLVNLNRLLGSLHFTNREFKPGSGQVLSLLMLPAFVNHIRRAAFMPHSKALQQMDNSGTIDFKCPGFNILESIYIPHLQDTRSEMVFVICPDTMPEGDYWRNVVMHDISAVIYSYGLAMWARIEADYNAGVYRIHLLYDQNLDDTHVRVSHHPG